MDTDWILNEALRVEKKTILYRRWLHENAEVGFSLDKTYSYVFDNLKRLGLNPQRCGKMGIVVHIQGEASSTPFVSCTKSTSSDDILRVEIARDKLPSCAAYRVLLRADMDALPMKEKTDLAFKCQTGCMHSCGHDMHTAMLLGAAEILSKNKEKFSSKITLMFQPAEETLEGAKDMIDSGLLDGEKIDYGIMIHVLSGTNLDTGSIILPNTQICAPSADFFEIEIKGTGAHGAMPGKSIDPILIGAHTILALEEIITRECAGMNGTALTIGEFNGGKCANVIPETIKISGSLRTYDESKREFLKSRIREVSCATASAFRGEARTTFVSGTPSFENSLKLSKSAYTCLKNAFIGFNSNTETPSFKEPILQEPNMYYSSLASEDFSHISRKIPSIMIALASGKDSDGYLFPLHNEKTIFDEKALFYGTIVYCILATSLK